jgi:putative sterol carrier protein
VAWRFGTEEWARALVSEINASSEYRNAAAAWGQGFNGNVLLVFEADGQLPATRRLLVRLAGGSSQGATFVAEDPHPEAPFTLRAPFALWREILEGKTRAATAILRGKLAVAGDTLLLLRYTAAHRALVHCAASVPTVWS